MLNNFRVRSIWANGACYRGQCIKITAPHLWDRAGILQILFVQSFNVGGVLSAKVRATQHALHESFSHRIPLFFTDEHVLSVMLFGLLLALFSSARIRWAHAHASLHYGLFRCFSVGQVSLPLGFAGRGLNRSTALPPPSFSGD